MRPEPWRISATSGRESGSPHERTTIIAAAPSRERRLATPRVYLHSTTVCTTAQQHVSQPQLLDTLVDYVAEKSVKMRITADRVQNILFPTSKG